MCQRTIYFVLLFLYVLALSAVWIGENELSRYSLEGYSSYLEERSVGRSGGVIIYVNDTLRVSVSKIGTEMYNGLRAEIQTSDSSFTLLLLYRFCGGDIVEFCSNLKKELRACSDVSVLVGDINLNIL